MHPIVENFCSFYHQLDHNSAHRLAEIYSRDVEFIDPIHHLKGIDNLFKYLHDMMKDVIECRFDITQVMEQENEAYVSWVMHFTHPRLNGSQAIEVPGVSFLRFNQRIEFHQDYYDVGAMLYEHIPLLGSVVGKIKQRLT